MKNYKVTISVGDKIAVGKFRNSVKTIKEITMEDDQPVVVTSTSASVFCPPPGSACF